MWFKDLTGFDEESPDQVRANLIVKGDRIISKVNNRSYVFGELEIVSLRELRERVEAEAFESDEKICIREVVGDVRDLHCEGDNEGALFQVASQFNLLEMVSPDVTPEDGVDRYEADATQGPACAIACGAGTIYRNYFADVNGRKGQTGDNQIDCLSDIGEALGNVDGSLWTMKNGYALVSRDGLLEIDKKLKAMSAEEREELKGKLRVGIMWNTEVTAKEIGQLVSQIYCSALPVAYCDAEPELWEEFASLVLEAAYEAAFYAAVENSISNSSSKLFLTLLGGGAFGNDEKWILGAIRKACMKFIDFDLDVKIVSYSQSKPSVSKLIGSLPVKKANDISDHIEGLDGDEHKEVTFIRLLWLIHALAGNGFRKSEYMEQFRISSRTADRDIEHLKNYINIKTERRDVFDYERGKPAPRTFYAVDRDGRVRRTEILALFKKCMTKDNYLIFYAFLKSIVYSGHFFPPTGNESESGADLDYETILFAMEEKLTAAEKGLFEKIEYNLSTNYGERFRNQFRNNITEIMKSFVTGKLIRLAVNRDTVKAEPLKIVFHDGRWYLTALVIELNGKGDDKLNTIENYDIGDIRLLRVDAEYFPYHEFIDTGHSDYFGLFTSGEIKKAVINLCQRHGSKTRSSMFHPSQRTETIPSGSGKEKHLRITLDYAGKDADELISKVLSFGADAEIVSPQELREQWLGELKAAADRYLKK
jgi:predicted DNA-binding transcriptional regulator YafY